MKFSKYFMLAGAAALFAACSSEEPLDGPQNNQEEKPVVGYTMVYLGGDETRADGEVTPPSESDIESVQFFLYKADGTLVDDKTITKDDLFEHNGKKQCAVVELSDIKITHIAALVNHKVTRAAGALLGTTNKYQNDNGYFIMSSATVYDGSNTPEYKVKIGERYGSYDDAKKANLTDAAKINVERLVAKVNVTKDKDFKTEITNVTNGNAATTLTVEFVPEYVDITARNSQSYLRKKLPAYDGLLMDSYLQGVVMSDDGIRSYWTEGVKGSEGLATLNYAQLPEEYPDADKVWDFTKYVRDHVGSTHNRTTSVIVAGKYIIKNGATVLADGTEDFYLVPDQGKYNFYKNKADAIKAMGGVGTETLTYDAETGWSSIPNKVVKCLYFNAGKGYYSRAIRRFNDTANSKEYYGIVRNHIYNINVTGISGMGIGINDPNQDIIPIDPKDPSNITQFLHMNVNVLPWEVVPTQPVAW